MGNDREIGRGEQGGGILHSNRFPELLPVPGCKGGAIRVQPHGHGRSRGGLARDQNLAGNRALAILVHIVCGERRDSRRCAFLRGQPVADHIEFIPELGTWDRLTVGKVFLSRNHLAALIILVHLMDSSIQYSD